MQTFIQSRSLSATLILSMSGTLAIVLCSQIRVDLPFTPVPITGQTFAVVLWGLLFGPRAGVGAVLMYLSAGALGMPVFAGFASLPALWGPTAGYLIGFIPAAWLAGVLRDSGWTQTFIWSTVSAFAASVPILILGTVVLSVFVGIENALMMGVIPFVVGDLVKSVIAAGIATAVKKK
ncbi:MAG: biotin transporter BioY [Ignavibacteria bacterium]|nr:biotin transporter BioY [Ignavibacteria bacterium]